MQGRDHLPMIAIVGRPNVGKSALFNLLVGRRISIVHEQSGVTRDRVVAAAHHRHKHFMLVDTGGVGVGLREHKHVDVFDGLVRDQVAAIVAEADAIIWVLDCQDGATPQDREIAELLHEVDRPVVLAANKADNSTLATTAEAEFSGFGFSRLVPTSCTHKRGIGALKDSITATIPAAGAPPADTGLKLAVVGRPNVGKSSLVNRLLGTDRVIVTDIAGTTRDAVDVPLTIRDGEEDIPVTLIDTAGLKRRRQVDTVVDFFSMSRTEKAIRRSDAVLMLLDATDPATAQDRRIARLICDAGKPCIMVANKWDVLSSGGAKQRDLVELIRDRIPFMKHAPLHVICALSGYNLDGLFERILALREQMQVMIPTSVLNQFLHDCVARTPPPSQGSRRFKLFYAVMLGNPPPRIALFGNDRRACSPNYLQFLENQLRDAFFPEAGLPVQIEIRERQGRLRSEKDGTRQAAAGVQRQRQAGKKASARHLSRRKGWRKR